MKRNAIIGLLVVTLLLTIPLTGCLDDVSIGFGDDDDEGFEPRSLKNVQVTTSEENTNEISVVVNPQNPDNIIVGANDYTTPHNDVWCGVYTSMDGGKNWQIGMIPGHPTDFTSQGITSPLKIFMGSGDPVLAAASDGSIYYAGIAFERTVAGPSAIFVARSQDGGITWPSSDISIVSYYGDGVTSFHDKEWIAVDPNNGNIYCVWAMFTAYSQANIMFSKSTDGGATWTPERVISEYYQAEFGNQGTYITVDNDGTIHIIWIDFEDNELLYVSSTDEGNSFSDPRPIADVLPIPYTTPGGTFRTPTLPGLTVDISGGESDGYLYACWNDYASGDADAMLIYSRDQGQSWSEPVRVNNDAFANGAWQFFPSVAVDERGWVHLLFYDTRDEAPSYLLNMYYAISKDFGESWEDIRLSTSSFNGEAGGGSWRGEVTNGDAFIGDYIEIDTTGRGTAIGGWSDCRNGKPSERNSDCYVGIVDY